MNENEYTKALKDLSFAQELEAQGIEARLYAEIAALDAAQEVGAKKDALEAAKFAVSLDGCTNDTQRKAKIATETAAQASELSQAESERNLAERRILELKIAEVRNSTGRKRAEVMVELQKFLAGVK